MRRVVLGSPPPGADINSPINRFILGALQEIQRASFENDTSEIADSYTLSNFTETRTLNAATATTADLANVLCTLLFDMQKRGVKKG